MDSSLSLLREPDTGIVAFVGRPAEPTLAAVRALSRDVVFLDEENATERPGGPALVCAVLVIRLPGISPATLASCLASWTRLGCPELVFLSGGDVADPLASALDAAGVRYLVDEGHAADWLLQHLPALSAYAQARRELSRARAGLPDVSRPERWPRELPEAMGLFRAEQEFRNTYLQVLMNRSSSRKEAAERAQVPYRTFCSMVDKLHLSPSRSSRRKTDNRD